MTTFLNNQANTAADTNFGQIGFTKSDGTTPKGADGIIAGATGQTSQTHNEKCHLEGAHHLDGNIGVKVPS